MKPPQVATLILRGNAVAMLLVALKYLFDLGYVYLYTPERLEPAGQSAMRYPILSVTFFLLISGLLFAFSKAWGALLAKGLE
jgi:hypothetical protein